MKGEESKMKGEEIHLEVGLRCEGREREREI